MGDTVPSALLGTPCQARLGIVDIAIQPQAKTTAAWRTAGAMIPGATSTKTLAVPGSPPAFSRTSLVLLRHWGTATNCVVPSIATLVMHQRTALMILQENVRARWR